MKKNLFYSWLMFAAILFTANIQAQMTVGGKKAPEPFSVLELLNKGGLRLPQMTTAQRDAFAVKNTDKGNGLTIYNSDTKCVEYWNASRWISMCDGTSQTTISPQPCVSVAADGTGCNQKFDITDPDCLNGPFNISIVAGSEYATLDADNTNGTFKINFNVNESVNIRTVLVRVTSTCTNLYKDFLFSQNGVDCSSMPYAVPSITASGTTLCTGGSVYLSVPANTANLDKLIWTRNGIEVARGVNYYVATQKGKYNISMGAVGCNTNAANEKNITESGTVAPTAILALASNDGVLCGTNSVTLSASVTTGSVVWFHNGVEEKSGSTVNISGDSSVGEWFAAVKSGSCYSNQSNTIQVKKGPGSGQITIVDADILVNGKPLNTFTSFCAGGSLDLSVANKQNGITYAWYNGNDAITVNPYIVPSSQATMSLRMIATDNTGAKCPAEAHVLEKNITTGNTPGQPSITGKTILCDGSTDLTIVPAAAGTYTYTWYKDNVKMSQTAQTITVSEGGLYNAAVTNTTGCTSTMAVKTVSSTVSSLPVVSWVSNPATATFGAKVTLQASGTFNPTSYTWTANNGATVSGSGASAAVQLPASGTDGLKVTVTVIAENECGKSVSLTHEITMNSACPTPVVTAQSSTAQNTTAGSAVTLSVSVTNAVQATYQWYSSPSGASISGATSASYLYTPSAAGTASFYCVVKNGCTGNPTGNSPVFTVTATANPENIAAGNGTLSGRTCFDIAQTEGGDTCGTLSSRLSLQADFTKSNINTQIYTFTPQGSVSNVHFQYVEKSGYKGEIVSNFEPNGYTVKVTYQTTLSGPQGRAKGLSTANAAYVTIYAIFNDGTGAEKAVKLKAEIKDFMCCGAKVSDTEWRAFMCHNLGTDQSLDPSDYTNPLLFKTNYYQWGSKDPISLVPGTTVGWIATRPAGMWSNPKNTTNDPCDPGYRVPTKAEWEAVIKYNTLTYKGVAGALKGGLQIGTSLFLPSEGNFFSGDVITSPLKPSGNLFYATTDVNGSTQYYFYSAGGNSATSPLQKGEQRYAFPVRCISEK